ncbi:probable rRNA maturation factor [Litoreibacter ascidiaceicola]|uniref:Endoribonuclease YbeY n=1 Tax=Litoreibacter ascidiaceicola TaxID=1486859 RepID=A0A1M5CMK0_9RHOB|nr:rRNA maturation RNase YbeY [Litoreibacter ascidiaceicola]SHF55984.1 probable rRNA maturation factor [Litoreibacter ascidiaceicola]
MAQIEILTEDERWTAAALPALAEKACSAALDELSLDADYEISLLACNDARVAELNTEFRGKPMPTNVLSWPSEERAAQVPGMIPMLPDGASHELELGDIAIAFETCTREADDAGKPFEDHVTHLLVHGTLHLLGFDHTNDPDAALMEGLETRILAKLGIEDPYRV